MDRKGFTLIELVMVIVLLGIIAVFVAPRMGNLTATKAGAFKGKLRADIRFAQNLAMSRNRRARVTFNGTQYNGAQAAPGSGYAVAVDGSVAGDCSFFALANDPTGRGTLAVDLSTSDYTNITITPNLGMTCLEYDSLGRPYNCGAGPAVCFGAGSLSGMTITVRANGAAVGSDIAVTTQTGSVN